MMRDLSLGQRWVEVYVPCMGEGSKSKRVRREQAPDVPLCMPQPQFIGAWKDVIIIIIPAGVGVNRRYSLARLLPPYSLQPAHVQRS